MGVYAASKKVLDYIPQNEYFGFDMLMLELLENKIQIGIYEHKGYWMDIGRPSDYEQAIHDMASGVFKY